MKKLLIILCALLLDGCAEVLVTLLMPSPHITSVKEDCIAYFQFQKDGKGWNYYTSGKGKDFWDKQCKEYDDNYKNYAKQQERERQSNLTQEQKNIEKEKCKKCIWLRKTEIMCEVYKENENTKQ